MHKDEAVKEKIEMAKSVAEKLLAKHGLEDWSIKTNKKRAVLAETWHNTKLISISKYFIRVAEKEEFEGVFLHEIAHALLGPGYGHGREFVDKCKSISSSADYASYGVSIPIRKYLLSCPECGQTGSNNRAEDRYCARCFEKGDIVKFNVKENELTLKPW